MPRPHVVLATHEVAPLIQAGGIGRHVALAARLLAADADVTVILPSQAAGAGEDVAGVDLGPGVDLLFAPASARDRFASSFHADAHEVAAAVAALADRRPVDLVEVDDYLGLGAVLVDAVRGAWHTPRRPRIAVRLHTTWELAQVLDGRAIDGAAARWVCALERRSLRLADVLLAPNAATGDLYQRFYGAGAVGPVVVHPPAVAAPDLATPLAEPPPASPLRVLYVGRLEARKGVRQLVEALVGLEAPDLELVLVGGDTDTGPAATSMRKHLEGLAGHDSRVRFAGRLEPDAVQAAVRGAHVVVLPSLFESFGYVLREALAQGRPVLATPVAGYVDALADPRCGWVTPGTGVEDLRAGLELVLSDRDRLGRLLADGSPRAALDDMLDQGAWTSALVEQAREQAPQERAVPSWAQERGSAVVLAGAGIARTVDSLAAQLDEDLEIIVVAEDAATVPRAVLDRVDALAPGTRITQLGAALAERAARGPVLVVEAGTAITPSAVGRLRSALRSSGAGAATAWGTTRRPGGRPLGGPEAELVRDADAVGSVLLLTPAAAERGELSGAAPSEALLLDRVDTVVVAEELVIATVPKAAVDDAEPRGLAALSPGHGLFGT